jgi:WD40 repeat protein
MQEVIVSLKETYEKVAGSRYPREEPSAAELMADGLNNRAVSLLDLNRRNQARSFLAQAVAADASHLAAVHNQAWLEWSEGRASDEELLSAVSRCDLPASERSRKHYLTALVHLNRADLSQAWQELARAADARSASASGAERSPALARQSIVELQIWAGYPAIEGFSPQTDMEAFWDHWRQRAFSCEETLRAPEGQALALRVSPDARRVLLVQETGLVVYDIAGRKMVWQADMPEQLLCAACFDSTGRRVIASTGGGGLLILDARNGVSRLKVSTAGRVYCLLDNVPGTDLLLAGEEQGQLNVMSQEDLSILCSHQAHTGPVRAVACCPTGSLAVSGGADGRLRLWRLPDLAAVQTWAAHDSWVSAVAVDGHCRRILSASYDGELALWEPGNERPVRRYLGHHWAVRALAACWERGLFASGGDRMLRLWHIQSGQCISTEHSGGKVWRCAAVASGQLVMTGLHAPAVFVYRLPASYQVILRPLLSRPKASGTLSEEQRLFSSLVEDTRRLFERGHLREAYERARQAQSIPGHADDEELLDILLKGMRLRQRKGLRAVWLRRELTAGDRPVACLALSAQDGRIFFSKADRAYSLGGLRDRTPEPLGGPLGQLINAMALSPSGRWLAAGTICMGRKADVMVLDTESGAAVRTLSGHTETVNALAFSPDGRLLASAGGDHTLRLWSVSPAERPDQWQQVRAFDRGNPLKAVAFSPDGGCLATGGVDRTVDLLDLGSMAIRETMAGHASEITGIAWTTGSPPLFSCAADGTLKSWAPGRRAALHSVTAHEAGVSCLAASGDSRFAASGGKEGTVRLWDLSSLQSLRIMPAHQREVSGLAITEDGGHLITAGYDGRITVWDMDWEFDLNGQITGPASADPAHSG